MSERKSSGKGAQKAGTGFSEEERAAMRERVREMRASSRATKQDGEAEVQAKIAEMSEPDRSRAKRIHALVRATAPDLAPRTWYGMPAYAKDGDVLCWFTPAEKFKARYATFSFGDGAHLDDGHLWPISYALSDLTSSDEARIVELLKKALG